MRKINHSLPFCNLVWSCMAFNGRCIVFYGLLWQNIDLDGSFGLVFNILRTFLIMFCNTQRERDIRAIRATLKARFFTEFKNHALFFPAAQQRSGEKTALFELRKKTWLESCSNVPFPSRTRKKKLRVKTPQSALIMQEVYLNSHNHSNYLCKAVCNLLRNYEALFAIKGSIIVRASGEVA